MRIILVEDDELLGKGIVAGFQQQNYIVDWFKLGEQALCSTQHESFDAMLLDLGLPDISGIEVLQRLRKQGSTLPVLILTALDGVDERISGLDAGADDYLCKPFDLSEVYARVRALTRRSAGRAEAILTCQNIILNPAAHSVQQNNKVIDLSRREYSVLFELMENSGRVLSRRRLEESLYSLDDDVGSNALEVHIHHLRKKLGSDVIRTIRGVGYTLDK